MSPNALFILTSLQASNENENKQRRFDFFDFEKKKFQQFFPNSFIFSPIWSISVQKKIIFEVYKVFIRAISASEPNSNLLLQKNVNWVKIIYNTLKIRIT